ncbi:MAG: hypothetical protein ACQEVA_13960 [Myxococcota bacterium]
MQRKFWPLFILAFALLAVACGRNNLERSCVNDADCPGDRVCVANVCTNPDDVPDGGDTEDPDADGGETGCTSNEDCDGGGMCISLPNDGCAAFECVIPEGQSSGTCEETPCDPNCGPGEVAEGCECIDVGCETSEDCGRLACVDGVCQPCTSDEDCPARRVCGEDGTCEEGVACEEDGDCPADKLCEGGTCVDRPECLLDTDCEEDEICLNGRCTFSPDCTSDADCGEGFECVGGQCFETRCRGPQDCEDGEICEAGECIVPDPTEIASCFVASKTLVVSQNQQVRLEAFAVDQDGEGVSVNFEWASDNPDVATIQNNQFAVGTGNPGTAIVTASVPSVGIDCEGQVELIGQEEVQPDQLRIAVFEGATGAPVSGAEVVLENGDSATTNSSGVAGLPKPQGAYTATVYDGRYNWVTIQNVQSDDIRIPVSKKSGTGPIAGFTGQFDTSRINTTGDITLGLAGASLTGGLIDLDLASLLGDPFVTSISIPGVGGQDIPLPGGLVAFGQVFGLQLDIKKTYYAKSNGGANLSWGLAGKVPAQRLIELFQGGGEQVDALSVLLPLFNRFDHAIRPLNLQDRPRVTDTQDIDGDGDTSEQVPDYDSFPMVDLRPSVQQNLVTDVDVSNFPIMSNGEASIAVLVGGTYLDQPGLVPLGISATNDEDGDGKPDARRLSVAPPHSSATGGRFVVMALAFRPDEVGFGGNGVELPEEFSASLWNGQRLASSISLGTFPDVSTGSVDSGAREVTVQADAGPLYRVQLVGQERTWEVWSLGTAGQAGSFSHTISVPQVAGGRTDLLTNGEVLVDSISTSVTLDDLVRATGLGLRDAGLVSSSFNRTRLR